jgi:hypothetical protein
MNTDMNNFVGDLNWLPRLLPRTPLGRSSQELPSRVVSFITLKPYEEKPHWSTSHLQKQWRHSTTCKKSNCFTTRTEEEQLFYHSYRRRAAVLPLVSVNLIEDVWFNALNDYHLRCAVFWLLHLLPGCRWMCWSMCRCLGAHRRFFSSVCCANPLCDLWYGGSIDVVQYSDAAPHLLHLD